jgi:cyd operon protein YbgT
MWYFSWILGLGLALTFGVLNAIWYDVMEQRRAAAASGTSPERPDQSASANIPDQQPPWQS